MYIRQINRILLGLLMLLPGLIKLYMTVNGGTGVFDMVAGIGFPVPMFFGWLLILSEIVFGIAILASWKLDYTVWPPIIIMLVAAFTVYFPNQLMKIPTFMLHLVAASGFLLLAYEAKRRIHMPHLPHHPRKK